MAYRLLCSRECICCRRLIAYERAANQWRIFYIVLCFVLVLVIAFFFVSLNLPFLVGFWGFGIWDSVQWFVLIFLTAVELYFINLLMRELIDRKQMRKQEKQLFGISFNRASWL